MQSDQPGKALRHECQHHMQKFRLSAHVPACLISRACLELALSVMRYLRRLFASLHQALGDEPVGCMQMLSPWLPQGQKNRLQELLSSIAAQNTEHLSDWRVAMSAGAAASMKALCQEPRHSIPSLQSLYRADGTVKCPATDSTSVISSSKSAQYCFMVGNLFQFCGEAFAGAPCRS